MDYDLLPAIALYEFLKTSHNLCGTHGVLSVTVILYT